MLFIGFVSDNQISKSVYSGIGSFYHKSLLLKLIIKLVLVLIWFLGVSFINVKIGDDT